MLMGSAFDIVRSRLFRISTVACDYEFWGRQSGLSAVSDFNSPCRRWDLDLKAHREGCRLSLIRLSLMFMSSGVDRVGSRLFLISTVAYDYEFWSGQSGLSTADFNNF